MSRSLIRAAQFGLRTKAAVAALGVRDVYGPVREPFPGAWQRGAEIMPIGEITSYSPVYASVSRIANDVAKLSLAVMVEDPALGTSTKAPAASPFWRVVRKPNAYQNRIQFVRRWLISKKLFGNTYALKVREEARGMVRALYVLDPRRTMPYVTPQGDVYYSIGNDDLSRVGTGMLVPATEVIHDLCSPLWHPLVGVSPIYACALSGTLGLTIQRNSANFFANASRPSGMLTGPGTIDEVTAARLKADWEANYRAHNLGRVAVLGDGLKYEAMTIAAEQSQLVEQLGITAVDVATAFSMPAYKINQGPMPTNNNVQALNQQYYSDCLQTDIEDIELCLTEGLELPSGYSIEFDLDGLLRMDSATQMEVLSKGVGGAILKPDEARRKLNMGPVPGGDAVYLQQQNYSLEALAKRDASDDPFKAAKPPAPEPAAEPAEPEPVGEGDAAAAAKADSEAIAAIARGAVVDVAAEARAATARAAELAATHAQSLEQIKALIERAQQAPRLAPAEPQAEDDDLSGFVDAFADLLAEGTDG